MFADVPVNFMFYLKTLKTANVEIKILSVCNSIIIESC